jgi:type VI secretion system protein ImpK
VSSDDDKTMFNPGGTPPQGDPGATIMIPNPGRRLRAEASVDAPPASAPSPAQQAPLPSSFDTTVKGQSNIFLAASNTLIAVLSALTNSMSHPNVAQLQQELSTEIGSFDRQLAQAGVRNEEAMTARYVLCSAIDEAVMNTPWGADSGWGQRSLLRVYHNETSGGERFFSLLDQLLARPSEYRDLLELFYVLLGMGFRGRYQLDQAGDSHVETLRERLYQDLYRDTAYDRALSDSALVNQTASQGLSSRVPLWVFVAITLALTLLVYSGLRAWMYSGTVDLVDGLDDLYPTQEQRPLQ